MKHIFTLLMVFALSPLFAQNNTEDVPTIEELNAKIERLEQRATRWEAISAHLPKISGYIQLRYDWNDAKSDFSIKRARVNFQGDILKSPLSIDYRLQLEFAGSPKIVDAYVRLKPYTELNLQVGQFKIPLTLLNTAFKPTAYEFVDTPIGISKLVGGKDLSGISGSNRDLGAKLYGGFIEKEGFSLINYDLAVMNGSGINCKDHNKSKDVIGRLTIQPLKALKLSGSFYIGETAMKNKEGETMGKHFTRDRYSVGMSYEDHGWVVRGEWIGGKTDMGTAVDQMKKVESSSWYASAAYNFSKQWLVGLRYDTFVQDTDYTSDSRQTNYTASLAWTPGKHFRTMVNYTYLDYRKSSDFFKGFKTGNHEVSVMISAMF